MGAATLFAVGSRGTNAAAVLAVPLAAVPLALALLDKLPSGRLSDELLRSEAKRVAEAVARVATMKSQDLLGPHGPGQRVVHSLSRSRAHRTASSAPAADSDTAAGTLEKIADFHRSLDPRRLVVIGAAGSGKSTMLGKLVQDLVETTQAPEQLPEPIPVSNCQFLWISCVDRALVVGLSTSLTTKAATTP